MKRIYIIITGFFLGALCYWLNPYNDLRIFGISIYLILAIGAFFGGMLLAGYARDNVFRISLVFSLGILLALLVRIVYDTTFWDPTSHNLAPFEFIIGLIIALPSAALGGFIYRGISARK